MARINIENKYWSDLRRSTLIAKIGDHFRVDGIMLNVWKLAEHYWIPHRKMIPFPVWKSIGIPDEIIAVGFAEIIDNEFIYVKGTRENFEWRFNRMSSGRRGGMETAKKNSKQRSSKIKQTAASPSSSSSSSFSSSSSISPSGLKNSETFASYAAAYETRYGTTPIRNAKVNSQLKQFIERVGAEEAPRVAEYFVNHTSQFYQSRGHTIGLLLADSEKLRTEWKTSREIAGQNSAEARSAGNMELLRKVRSGEL